MTTLEPSSFDFYVDKTHAQPLIGLQVNSASGTVRIPMTVKTAGDIGAILVSHAANM